MDPSPRLLSSQRLNPSQQEMAIRQQPRRQQEKPWIRVQRLLLNSHPASKATQLQVHTLYLVQMSACQ